MITKEEVEEHIGRKLFQFDVKSNYDSNGETGTLFYGRIDFINKEQKPDACVFSFLVNEYHPTHINWKTMALNRIKYKIQDYMKEKELGS